MVVNTKLTIGGTEYTDVNQILINKSTNDFNTTSDFTIEFDNINGEYNDEFSLNDEVIVYADLDATPTTKIFLGVIENIKYMGKPQKDKITLTGRDYGAVLMDIIVSPRIYKNTETSEILKALMIQNANTTGITMTNVNATSTTIDKITFNNICLFDALKQLGEISGFYFFIDNDKDLNFIERDSVSSGLTFNNTNVTNSTFRVVDNDIFNSVTVYGDRQLTGVREVFGTQAGSIYFLDDKPSNVTVIGSANPNVYIQPGGIEGISDPSTDDVHFLVNYNSKSVTLTSGTAAGYNTGWIGSTAIIIDYQRSSPLISIREDDASQTAYGKKDKMIIDRNIKELDEANLKANTYLAEHKDPTIQGSIEIYGVCNVNVGQTAVIDIPWQNVSSQTYMILTANYSFNKSNNLSNQVLKVNLNKKVRNFIDYMKEQELRLRNLEGSEVDTSITNLSLATGSIHVESSYVVISYSLGSAFMFHVPNHNKLDSSTSLLGPIVGGSIVITS